MEDLRREVIGNMDPHSRECNLEYELPVCPAGSLEWASPVTRSSNCCWAWLPVLEVTLAPASVVRVTTGMKGRQGWETKVYPTASCSGSITGLPPPPTPTPPPTV